MTFWMKKRKPSLLLSVSSIFFIPNRKVKYLKTDREIFFNTNEGNKLADKKKYIRKQ